MDERALWRRWKPFAVPAVVAFAGICWWNTQSEQISTLSLTSVGTTASLFADDPTARIAD